MIRKLASIQEIRAVEPIPGKDRIELAHVQGWTVIVGKGEYKPGDLTVYVEIDSVLPERPEFEFLRKKNFRIKTMKINGQLEDGTKVPVFSQGICFPVSILPGNVIDRSQPKSLLIDTDVTEFLGVQKYDEYGDLANDSMNEGDKLKAFKKFAFRCRLTRPFAKAIFKKKSGAFPDFVSKTDETRIQSLPYLQERKDTLFVGREKIDGQSGTFALCKIPRTIPLLKPKFEFIVCSRNRRIPEPDNSSFWTVARQYNIENVLRKLIGDQPWVCIQGEVVGPRIQGNKYKLSEVDLYCFNLIYPSGKVKCFEAEKMVGKYGLKWVPLVVSDYRMPDTVEEVLTFATGKSAICNTLREGIVFRNYDEDISFKAVSPEFLIKNDV